jgi:hypothetical protein
MPDLIPFTPGDTNYRVGVALTEDGGAVKYWFDVKWNARDNVDPVTGIAKGAHYFDIRELDESVVALDIKVVLGVNLGRTSTHPFFTKHLLRAVDTTGKGKDAGFDDLGGRVVVMHWTVDEIFQSTTV